MPKLPLDRILIGDCVDILEQLPEKSVDVVFADPPYNLQLQGDLYRPNMTKVDAVVDAWDRFDSVAEYDAFCRRWLTACRRVLKDTGTLWVIGSYHNIYRVGTLLLDLDYWILNDVVWIKRNPLPNLRGTRLTNAHETLLWAQKCQGASYTFNYHALKTGNEDRQVRSVWEWELPVCSGAERLMVNGEKAHTTQKPESLLWRVIASSTNPGDVILDPFFGTGTTGAVARKLRRHYIGIERDPNYVRIARARIRAVQPASPDADVYTPSNKPRLPRVPFATLIECGLLEPGQQLRFGRSERMATIMADGALLYQGERGSIHKIGTQLQGAPCNGWEHWHYYDSTTSTWQPIDQLRQQARAS
jgi:modification methylase